MLQRVKMAKRLQKTPHGHLKVLRNIHIEYRLQTLLCAKAELQFWKMFA